MVLLNFMLKIAWHYRKNSPDTGHGAGPAMPRVPQAMEEDDGGSVLAAGGHHHRLRHPVEEGLSAHTETLAFTALSLGAQAAHTLQGGEC